MSGTTMSEPRGRVRTLERWLFGDRPEGAAPLRRPLPWQPHSTRTCKHVAAPRPMEPAEACADCGSTGGGPGEVRAVNTWRRSPAAVFGVPGVLCSGCRSLRLEASDPHLDRTKREVRKAMADTIREWRKTRFAPEGYRHDAGPEGEPWDKLTDAEVCRRLIEHCRGRQAWDVFGALATRGQGGGAEEGGEE